MPEALRVRDEPGGGDSFMSKMDQFVEFLLDEQRYALPLAAVERIVRAVHVTKMPESPAVVFGIINVGGVVVPVIDLRRRFGLRDRPMRPDDRLILADTPRWKIALWVDSVSGVFERPKSDLIPSGKLFPGIAGVSGAVKLDGDIIQIYDLEKCLSIDDESLLGEVMSARSDRWK